MHGGLGSSQFSPNCGLNYFAYVVSGFQGASTRSSKRYFDIRSTPDEMGAQFGRAFDHAFNTVDTLLESLREFYRDVGMIPEDPNEVHTHKHIHPVETHTHEHDHDEHHHHEH